jgi:hypothetical protein
MGKKASGRHRSMEGQMDRKVNWSRAATFEMIQFSDGSGVLSGAVLKPCEGVRITGNGSLQAPLAVEIMPGYRLVREG